MKERNNRGFTLVELMIVIGVIAILMGLVVVIGPQIFSKGDDLTCKNNLRNIHSALNLYKTAYGSYPDVGGDLFLAKLYYTGYLTDYKTFICPSDKSRDNAEFTDKVAERIGKVKDQEEDDDDPTVDWNDDTIEPTEISYAARWNVKDPDDHPKEEWYHLNDDPSEATPLVCDDDENSSGQLDDVEHIHDDHINVLWTNGKVEALFKRIKVGQEGTVLEPLKN